ncbi:S8 family peptidase [Streptomyces liangshanensis]|uniref:S8 family peptidase n=1 Tax=Streptomyces liangshanensis TaxID=2717324 RepID=UPI0036DBE685
MPSSARRFGALISVISLAAGLQLAAAPTAQSIPTGEVRLAAPGTAVPNSWIVVLKDGSTSAADLGATPRHVYRSALQGFSASMSATDARRIAADPRVSYVQQDAEFHAAETQANPTWGIDRVDQRDLPLSKSYSYASSAPNVTAYILDTGIRTTHSEFGGRASIGTDTIGDGQNGRDCHGHGTHVAGTIGGRTYGVAKSVKLVAVRVLNCQSTGSGAQIIAGIDWVTAHAVKPAVANMSLTAGAYAPIDDAVRRSIASGVTYAIAAGNGDSNGAPQNACDYSPGRVAQAITVGATDEADRRASFSNFGTCLDLFAPGVNVVSSYLTNDTATRSMSGTSMATPHTVGVAAQYLATHPTATPQQVRDALVAGATTNKVVDARTGSPNRLLFTQF